MGFNIGVSSNQTDNNFECDHFIDRNFYNFVNSLEMDGDKSIIVQCGQYYELDLSPLTKLVYSWDNVSEEYIKDNLQDVDFLLALVTTFQNKIKNDKSVCDKIHHTQSESFVDELSDDIQKLVVEIRADAEKSLIEMMKWKKRELKDNSNSWKWYFEGGQIIDDLENLIKSIKCYKDKGITEIYLTAG